MAFSSILPRLTDGQQIYGQGRGEGGTKTAAVKLLESRSKGGGKAVKTDRRKKRRRKTCLCIGGREGEGQRREEEEVGAGGGGVYFSMFYVLLLSLSLFPLPPIHGLWAEAAVTISKNTCTCLMHA